MAVTVPRWYPEAVNWALSSEYHNVPGGHVRIYRPGPAAPAPAYSRARPSPAPPCARTAQPVLVAALRPGARQRGQPRREGLPPAPGLGHHGQEPRHALARGRAQPRAGQEPRHLCPQAAGAGQAHERIDPGRDPPDRRLDRLCAAAGRDGPLVPGGHADPWNHVEATMALAAGGRWAEVERAFEWLAAKQLPDGSWCPFYVPDGVIEPRRDPNMCAYVATGAWWCAQLSGEHAPCGRLGRWSKRAIAWCLRYQRPGGEVTWSVGPDGVRRQFRPAGGQFVAPAFAAPAPPGSPRPSATQQRPAPGGGRRPGWRTPSPTGPRPSPPKPVGRWTGTTRC